MILDIKDCVKIIGRGTILICDLPNDMFMYVGDFIKMPICHVGDIIYIKDDDSYYSIRGIEKLGNSSNTVGFIINTNKPEDTFKNKKFSLCTNSNQL